MTLFIYKIKLISSNYANEPGGLTFTPNENPYAFNSLIKESREFTLNLLITEVVNTTHIPISDAVLSKCAKL